MKWLFVYEGGKITERHYGNACIKNMFLYLNGKEWARIGGPFSLRDAMKQAELIG